MSTSTFSYDTATADGIVSKVTASSDFLHISHSEVKTRDLEREHKKLIGSELHCATLAEYYKNALIPRGLRVHLRPNLFPSNKDYCEKFETILNKCSMDIIVLSIDYLQKSILESKDKIAAIETQLSATISPQELCDLKNQIEKTLDEHRKYIEQTKRSKYIRDTEDYQLHRVYRWQWQEQNTYGHYPNADYASSSSGSERPNYRRQRFFNRRGNRSRRKQRGYGGDDTLAETEIPSMQTRSQTR
ncbi:uncharacterized protein LOC122941387 [Bufo gargarizans]|uniref:uncharacterized protein LOC122941387 n=1 Tax=Bufo gargarizans TaxID=30331 RepID=UPI001CF1AC27|nr:uncharacterized protein LOC122941387 [Bufo gargarizans]XP_044154540.1 uncharacterized protein LOC122941387 [Bufo gargarizans]